MSLINSKTVLAIYEQEISQQISRPNCQKLKIMVKRHVHGKIRARNPEARKERIETGVLVKTRQGKHVSVARTQGEGFQRKAKEQSTKGNACSFRPVVSKRGKSTQSSSPAPKTTDSKRLEMFFGREISQRPRSFWIGIPETVQRPPQYKLCASVVYFWHPRMSTLQNTIGMQIR